MRFTSLHATGEAVNVPDVETVEAPEAPTESNVESATPPESVGEKVTTEAGSTKPPRDNGMIPRERYNKKNAEAKQLQSEIAELRRQLAERDSSKNKESEPEHSDWDDPFESKFKKIDKMFDYLEQERGDREARRLERKAEALNTRLRSMADSYGDTKEISDLRFKSYIALLSQDPNMDEEDLVDIVEEKIQGLAAVFANRTQNKVAVAPKEQPRKPGYANVSAPDTNTNPPVKKPWWKKGN